MRAWETPTERHSAKYRMYYSTNIVLRSIFLPTIMDCVQVQKGINESNAPLAMPLTTTLRPGCGDNATTVELDWPWVAVSCCGSRSGFVSKESASGHTQGDAPQQTDKEQKQPEHTQLYVSHNERRTILKLTPCYLRRNCVRAWNARSPRRPACEGPLARKQTANVVCRIAEETCTH